MESKSIYFFYTDIKHNQKIKFIYKKTKKQSFFISNNHKKP